MAHTALDGFILTRHWRDGPAGTELEYWLATDEGPLKVVLTGQPSVAFAEARHASRIRDLADEGLEVRDLELRTFQRAPVVGIYARHHRQLNRLARQLQGQDITLLESDVRPEDRYLMERFITAAVSVEGVQVHERTLVNARLRPHATYRPALRMLSLDIETSQHADLYCIGLASEDERVVLMLGEGAPAPGEAIDGASGLRLVYCTTRRELIRQLNEAVQRIDPDVLVGWNVIQFDLKVLQATAEREGLALALGREGRALELRRHPGRQDHLFAHAPGRLIVDGIDALKSASWSFPSFSLETVSQALLREGKSIGDEYDKMAEIERRFREEPQELARYNIQDCDLVLRIFEKAKLLAFAMERAHATGLQADRFGGSIAAFSHHYLPRMHRLGYVAPNAGAVADRPFPGGYVMDSRPGFYDSVVVLDYKSLYPSIIRTFLVDPVGYVEGEAEGDAAGVIKGPLGTRFSRSRHCLPDITTALSEARDEAKRRRNEPLSQALKLLMNSFAGVLGAAQCRFFDPKLVSAITLRGHQIMKRTQELVRERGYEAIYGDTDSIFIWLGRAHPHEEAMAVARDLTRHINGWWHRDLREDQDLESFLEIEFDTHYRKFFMPTIRGSDVGSKKRYAGLSTSDNGAEEVVYRGLEMARSDWTPLARQFQEGLLTRVFHGQPYARWIADYARSTISGEKDELLIYRKRVRHRLDAYTSNTPPQVRAARAADDFNRRLGRPPQYQSGGWIRYVMTINGPEPLETRQSRVDYAHYLKKQLLPIADAILQPLGQSFEDVVSEQQALF